MYPISKQEKFVTNSDKLQLIAPGVADAFRGLRKAQDSFGTLEPKQRELCLLAGFAATRNEDAFRIHCTRATQSGATVVDIEQMVLLMLGTSLGLAPVVETLGWVHDELR